MTSLTPGQALADIFERVIHVTVLELAGEERYAAIPWDELKPLAVQLGAALLNAIEMREYAVVPLEPTAEMLDRLDRKPYNDWVNRNQAAILYQEMIPR